MLISRRSALLSLAGLVAVSNSTLAEDAAKPFLTEAEVPLAKLLVPPPAAESDGTKAELAGLKTYVATRTNDIANYAANDDDVSLNHFLALMSIPIDIFSMPQTKSFFEALAATVEATVNPAKQAFNRARPTALDPAITSPIPAKNPGSYPSAHATLGYLYAIMLSEIAPEKKTELFVRGNGYAYNRFVLGLNFATDVEAGKVAAAAIAAVLWRSAELTKQFAAAKAELRPAMGL